MRILMAMDTEVFPVGAIGRIVGVVAVDVVHGQLALVLFVELAGALGADHAVHFQGQGAVVVGRFLLVLHLAHVTGDFFGRGYAFGLRAAGSAVV